MKSLGLIALVVVGTAATAATAGGRHSATPNAQSCGGTLWRLKTFSDDRRLAVRLTPQTTTVVEIGKRPFPRPVPRRRRTPYQRQVWKVVAQITKFRRELGGMRMVLFDSGSYLNAVIPVPACLSARTRARDRIAETWKAFTSQCGDGSPDWKPLGAIVYVSGVGFWSQRAAKPGAARNGAELYPATDVRIVAGC